jgi:hypothetical protein
LIISSQPMISIPHAGRRRLHITTLHLSILSRGEAMAGDSDALEARGSGDAGAAGGRYRPRRVSHGRRGRAFERLDGMSAASPAGYQSPAERQQPTMDTHRRFVEKVAQELQEAAWSSPCSALPTRTCCATMVGRSAASRAGSSTSSPPKLTRSASVSLSPFSDTYNLNMTLLAHGMNHTSSKIRQIVISSPSKTVGNFTHIS